MPKHAPTWPLAASAFNWTPDLIRAESGATEIAVGIVSDGIAPIIEVELGQLWRSFPVPSDAEAESLRDALAAAGGRVSIVGASIDDWAAPTRRRDDDERMSFLLPQLRAAHRLGATGVRLPIGQSGVALLERSLLDDVAFFAVGAVLVGVGFCAIRFPGLFWSPRSLTRESPPCRPACASRENPRDRRDDEGTRTHLSR